MSTHPTDTTIDTVVIGAGQSGLATGYHLQRRGLPFVILDAADRVGDGWRHQWDSLRLYSPARYDALPGMAFPAPAWSYPGKDQVADYLESYAQHFDLPVRLRTRVRALEADGDHGYVVRTDTGDHHCSNVVVATGTFGRTPHVPDLADRLDPSILQLHSSEYRRPGQLREGPVLVVGASHSGSDIAYEAAATHPTILAGRDCGQIPPRLDSAKMRLLFPVLMLVWNHVLNRRTPVGRRALPHVRHHGGPMLRVKRSDLAGRGVERVTSRVEAVEDGRPVVDGDPPRRGHRGLGDGFPSRPTTGSTCPSWATTAGRGRCAAWPPTRRGSSSTACASSTRSPRCCWPAPGGTPATSSTGSPPASVVRPSTPLPERAYARWGGHPR